jgi:hypothetical protein
MGVIADMEDIGAPGEWLSAVNAAQDEIRRLTKEIARLTAMLTPKPLDENAPKDRELIGVDRPPCEDRTYYRMIEWREDEQRWMTQCGVDWETRKYIWAFCSVTHYLDPMELPGLPYYDGSDIEVDEWDEDEQP